MRDFVRLAGSLVVLVAVLTALPKAEDLTPDRLFVQGTVHDHDGPVPGATVTLMASDSVVAGTATDVDGKFYFDVHLDPRDTYAIRVSSVGHQTVERNIYRPRMPTAFRIGLVPKSVAVNDIRVQGEVDAAFDSETIGKADINRQARRSVIGTNPMAAVRQPNVSRRGSNHSSRLRMDGTPPEYIVDGAGIGTDPDHYGMFSFLPTPAVDRITVSSRGGQIEFERPATVEIATPRPYNTPLSAECNASVIELTAALSLGNDNRFVHATARRSLLDQLVNRIDIRSGRRSIPPAGFHDLFVSVGKRWGLGHELVINQYHVYDQLRFNPGSGGYSSSPIDAHQKTDEHLVSAAYTRLLGKFLLKATAGFKWRSEAYSAVTESNPRAFNVDLDEKLTEFQMNSKLSTSVADYSIKAGFQYQSVLSSRSTLQHRNWNFLAPDANSDNPHMYQPGLNRLYGSISTETAPTTFALFGSASRSLGKIDWESGLRLQVFDGLAKSVALLHRHRIGIRFTEELEGTASIGTYARHPFDRILQPFQVLVRAQAKQLAPVRTEVASLGLQYRNFTGRLHAKQIRSLPALTPQFGPTGLRQLAMQSNSGTRILSGDVSYSDDSLLFEHLDLSAFYTYTHAVTTQSGYSYPYDLHAPHKLEARVTYRLRPSIDIGAELMIRTGYPYTAYRLWSDSAAGARQTEAYYHEQLAQQNGERFPVNYQMNLHLAYDFGRSELYLNVANVTNRANPIINTYDGFVYDAGILPSIGYRLSF